MSRSRLFPGLSVCLLALATSVSAEESTAKDASSESKPVVVAHIEVRGSFPEGAGMPGLFGDVTENLSDMLARLKKAAQDDEVTSVVLKLDGADIGWAKLNELRTGIAEVRKSGKQVYAWLDGGSSKDYLLAAACDKIIMPESGALMVLGMRAEVTFYKNLFDFLDIKPDMLRVGEFKSAAEPYTRTEMSEPFRMEMEAILDDYYEQMIDMIVESRGLDREAVVKAIDSGPHTAKAAHELGLIDRLAYEDELEDYLEEENAGRETKINQRYGKRKIDADFSGPFGPLKLFSMMLGMDPEKQGNKKPKIAVIHATGMIMSGSSTSDLFGTTVMGSRTMVKAIQKAAEDDTVKAIVLRIDSPGGSALASDLIWHALENAGKPVVASMGDTAASGGYYIAMGADRIFAEPGTLTGSIGVVGGKLAYAGLLNKAGVTTSVISRGKNSGVMSPLQGFTDSEREAMTKLLHDIYDQFTKKAAEGRGMEHEKLEKLARGRVYTGRMAQEIGLVDELGTLDDAITHAKKLAEIDSDQEIEKMVLPKPVSPFEALFGPIDGDASLHNASATGAVHNAVKQLSPDLAERLKSMSVLELLAREPRLTVLPFRVSVD